MDSIGPIVAFEIEIPQDEFQAAIRRKTGDTQTPDGFRNGGHMPVSYILKKFGEELFSEVLQDLLTKRIKSKILRDDLDVAHTHVTGKWNLHDRPLRFLYEVILDLYPIFEVQGLDDLRLRPPKPTVVDENHVNAAIEVLRRGHSTWRSVDRPSAKGDRVRINFHSVLSDGSTFPGGKADDVSIELGSGGMLPEFEKHLTGVTPGQKLDFAVYFPDDYGTPMLRGKTGFFSVLVLSVTEFDSIPTDQDLTKKCIISGGIAELREATCVHLRQQHEQQDRHDTESDLLRQLALANVISLPQGLVVQQLQALQAEAVQRGIPIEQVQNDEGLLEQAQYRVHLSVVVRRLAQQEQLQFDKDRDLTEQVIEWLRLRAIKNAEIASS